jgi:cytochrome c-type biogenesis protein CcmH/NrfG
VNEIKLTDGQIIAASIIKTSDETASRLVESNHQVADKLLESDTTTAFRLEIRNQQVDETAEQRFHLQKRWYHSLITISLLTLLILLLFTAAFFEFAIIVKE